MLFCDESVTLSMSAASLRLWAMSSDSVSRSLSSVVLYNWPTSSLCRQSFTWFTRKCITAFGTLRPNAVKRIVRINDVNVYSVADEKPWILTCLGCFSEQWGNKTWWVSRWPHSLSAPEQTTFLILEQADNERRETLIAIIFGRLVHLQYIYRTFYQYQILPSSKNNF